MTETWIADDDRGVRFVLAEALRDAGHSVREFSTGDAVRAALAESRPDLLVTDVRMPGEDGLHLLEYLTRRNIGPVIVMSAYTDVATTAAAYRAGAADYIAKPFDLDLAVQAVERALAAAREEVVVPPTRADTHPLLGESAAMREVFRLIGRVAASDLNVLITGETGTGKELVARALHDESARRGKPYVTLNTAAIPSDLLESELFGHEAGAFPGATRRHAGRFEQAEGGTLFLDEIGDMPIALQARLQRALAGGEFYRVGGREFMRGDVRIVAATQQDLDARVTAGHFRADLKHHLDVARIHLPSLRDRRDDIPLLAKHFLAQAATELNLPPKRFSRGAMKLLEQREYPGNVRELENLCRRLAVIAPAVEIQAGDLGSLSMGQARGTEWTEALRLWAQDALAQGEPDIHNRAREALDKTLLQVALLANDGHRQNAAAALGVGRNTLTRKLGASRKRRPSNG
ncbi:nitrogen regulation protein NR(I) [Luteibacter yeojuensis]|uniref:DNA-binding transcriptional regulator NtrC n=1 Tax=Luteibacter yeojuensis TaxID=345309 RepID=A0A7X5QWQ8_9GAMM|nr:nitrogen regulation protein NR(I) [Luteibacter yeojuensis]NID16725.1 nitrogen regulation protein NR(I) [Luteibacter yeojuensis]